MFSPDPNKHLADRITFSDIALISFLVAVSIMPVLFRAPGDSEKPAFVKAVTENRPNLVLSINQDGIYHLAGPLGDSIAEIQNGRVRMKSSPCPNKLCIREGWKTKAGQVIICAPNRVGLLLIGEKDSIDAITR